MDPMTRMGMQQRMPGMDPNMQQRMPGMDPGMQQRMPGMDPNMQQRMPGMDPSMQQRMPGMDPRMHHPNMGMNQVNHPGMMRPMGAGHMPGYPGHSASGNSMPGSNMAAANPNHNNMANPATPPAVLRCLTDRYFKTASTECRLRSIKDNIPATATLQHIRELRIPRGILRHPGPILSP